MRVMDELQHSPMAKPLQSDAEFRRETSDRLRRLETRLTRYMEWAGFDTEVRRPVFTYPDRLDIPTDATSIRDCLAAIPVEQRGQTVTVVHKGDVIATLSKQ